MFKIFALMFTWDFMATISIRFISTASYWAAPIAAISTLFFIRGVVQADGAKKSTAAAMLGAALGTALAILLI
jgi:hypothetical protein